MYEAIRGKDVVDHLKPLFENAWYIDPISQKLMCMPSVATHAPWVYINPRPDIHCDVFMAMFKTGEFKSRKCRTCFKVCIRPKTVAQLVRLHDLMQTKFIEQGLYCKCGIEERPFVFGSYGGYNYNQGLREGRKNYKTIRKMIDAELGKDVVIYLKSGCTEMELALGPSKEYVVPDWADELEDKILEVVKFPDRKTPTPKWVAVHTIRKWLEFAWDRGDETCLEVSGGIPIFSNHLDFYHEEV